MDTVERNKTSEVSLSSGRTSESLDYFIAFRLFQWQLAEEKFAQGYLSEGSGLGSGVGAISIH